MSCTTSGGSSTKARVTIDSTFEQFLDDATKVQIAQSPEFLTYIGSKDKSNQLDDYTDAGAKKSVALNKKQLAQLRKFDRDELSSANQLNYDLFEENLEDDIEGAQYRNYGYPINQMFGVHSSLPAFIINQHRIDDEKDANAYISRISELGRVIRETTTRIHKQGDNGVILPKFIFPKVYSAIDGLFVGSPFGGEGDSAMLADFVSKVSELNLGPAKTDALVAKATAAMVQDMKPAYDHLTATLEQLERRADNRAGVWRFDDGADYYSYRLRTITTTDMTPTEIHQLGLEEMARIHDEMRSIMQKVGFSGNLQDFFKYMRTSPRFYYANTDEGREQYLSNATRVIDEIQAQSDVMFSIKPKAPLVVKRVETFREKSAGTAFYGRPALDGSRPGIYYVNLFDMSNMPTYQLEALAYHEGVPGHHMQLAISQELDGLPLFRRLGGHTAYTEGWGLYSEWLPKKFGYYTDPYSDFGRLAMEAWRAARLVTDTGLHHKRWSRQQAVDYLVNNTADTSEECERAIDRYAVMPGQATAYKIGMLKIQELLHKSEHHLGDNFDIRDFHDVILKQGSLPLDILERHVNEYIAHGGANH